MTRTTLSVTFVALLAFPSLSASAQTAGRRPFELRPEIQATQSPEARQAIAERAVDAFLAAQRESAQSGERQKLIEKVVRSRVPVITMETAIQAVAPADTTDLVFTPLPPCRIIDTRLAGGPIAAGTTRAFLVAGSSDFAAQGGVASGCGVPLNARSVLINFVAVAPQGGGNLKAWEYSTTEPAQGSIINYSNLTPQLNIANGVPVPVCGSPCVTDINVKAVASATQLVGDVFGYFAGYPKEAVRPFVVRTNSETTVNIGDSCTNHSSVTIGAPVTGTVEVEANVISLISHANGSDDEVIYFIGTSALDCNEAFADRAFASVTPALPTGEFYPQTTVTRTYTVSAGTYTYYLNAYRTEATSYFYVSQLKATFYPD